MPTKRLLLLIVNYVKLYLTTQSYSSISKLFIFVNKTNTFQNVCECFFVFVFTLECVKHQKTAVTNGMVNKKIASEVTVESILTGLTQFSFFSFLLFKTFNWVALSY